MTTPVYTGNTKYGSGALKINNFDGGNNSAFGVAALSISTEKWNTAVGAYSGLATTIGISNTSVGTNTLLQNTSGNYNTALGTASLCLNTGSGNTAVGSNSIEYNLTGENNTIIGTETGKSIVTGSNNICLGYKAGTSGSSAVDYSNCILIGNNVYPTASGQAIIGEISQTSSMELVCSQNPTMSGYPVPAPSDDTNNIATCKWVQAAIFNGGGGGSSLLTLDNTWTGINTFNNLVSVNTAISTSLTPNDPSFVIKDTPTNNTINFNPQILGGQYNYITQPGSLICGDNAINTSTLTLTTHSATTSGIVLTATSAMIGAGGTSSIPSSNISFSGTNAQVTGTLSIDNKVSLNSSTIFDRQVSSSYYNFYSTATTSLLISGRMYGADGVVVSQSYASLGEVPGKFVFYSRDISLASVTALTIDSTSITTPCIIVAPSTLIGNSTINAVGNNNIYSYMSGNINAYINNATSGIISFYTNDNTPLLKNPLQLSSTGIKIVDGSLTFPDSTVQTTAYTGVASSTQLIKVGGYNASTSSNFPVNQNASVPANALYADIFMAGVGGKAGAGAYDGLGGNFSGGSGGGAISCYGRVFCKGVQLNFYANGGSVYLNIGTPSGVLQSVLECPSGNNGGNASATSGGAAGAANTAGITISPGGAGYANWFTYTGGIGGAGLQNLLPLSVGFLNLTGYYQSGMLGCGQLSTTLGTTYSQSTYYGGAYVTYYTM